MLERIDEPAKRWKFSIGDIGERKLWNRYMEAYEDAIRNTASREAPWYVVPADNKWFTRLVFATILTERMEALDPRFPVLGKSALRELQQVRRSLEPGGRRKT